MSSDGVQKGHSMRQGRKEEHDADKIFCPMQDWTWTLGDLKGWQDHRCWYLFDVSGS